MGKVPALDVWESESVTDRLLVKLTDRGTVSKNMLSLDFTHFTQLISFFRLVKRVWKSLPQWHVTHHRNIEHIWFLRSIVVSCKWKWYWIFLDTGSATFWKYNFTQKTSMQGSFGDPLHIVLCLIWLNVYFYALSPLCLHIIHLIHLFHLIECLFLSSTVCSPSPGTWERLSAR